MWLDLRKPFITLKAVHLDLRIRAESVKEGKAFLVGQFSPSKFLVRNCASNVFILFPKV